jgi:hypothetical protein
MATTVTIFGSSVPRENDIHYATAFECGKYLAGSGFSVCNGGYGGTMEAAAKGSSRENRLCSWEIFGKVSLRHFATSLVAAWGAKILSWYKRHRNPRTSSDCLEHLFKPSSNSSEPTLFQVEPAGTRLSQDASSLEYDKARQSGDGECRTVDFTSVCKS